MSKTGRDERRRDRQAARDRGSALLLDSAEQRSARVKAADLAEIIEVARSSTRSRSTPCTGSSTSAGSRSSTRRAEPEPAPPPRRGVVESTTDALQLFLREAGRHPLLTAAQEVELAKKIERGYDAVEAADDPVEPPPRRLDREELPQPGPARSST